MNLAGFQLRKSSAFRQFDKKISTEVKNTVVNPSIVFGNLSYESLAFVEKWFKETPSAFYEIRKNSFY